VLTIAPLKDEIAKSAGIDPHTLIAGAPQPGSTTPAPEIGNVAPTDRRASLLTVTAVEKLPILSISVTAPDQQIAARLSNGAIKVLVAHINQLGNADNVPVSRRVVVRQMGTASAATAKRGPSRKIAALASVFLFGLVCAAIIGSNWLKQRWRQTEGLELFPPIEWSMPTYAETIDEIVETSPEPLSGAPPPPPPPPQPPGGDRWDTVA
jgi:hypothetical protein